MLSRMRSKLRVFSQQERKAVTAALVGIIKSVRRGTFSIAARDQDVHLAVERVLTRRLGAVGKRVHTGRSRNDQVAVDLRLYGKERLLGVMDGVTALAKVLLTLARKHATCPMVGRTHMQPAMPSSVGLWASAHAESLLDDMIVLQGAYKLNDQCPLGAAAGFGVPLAIDRNLTSDLLGFRNPVHNVLYAGNARGKCEAVILSSMSQVMLSLSRLAEDLLLYSMPEFGYFSIPAEYCTGSSIMPQKKNPDVLELVRARGSRVSGYAGTVLAVMKALPSGYNRDLQETKEPFIEGVRMTLECLKLLKMLLADLKVDRKKLVAAFTPGVFATDRAIELVGKGVPFRDAYNHVRLHLDALESTDPRRAVAAKTHLGATSGLDFDMLTSRVTLLRRTTADERRRYHKTISKLLGTKYPDLT